ncbi:MAG: methyl-accepting chemotaxis protein [Bacillota bacterium]|nr:methyl-accepting chemotaxis protein [Bacillota bacterium]
MDKNGGKSLVARLITFMLLLLVLPILIAGYYLYSQVSNDLTQMEKERVQISSQASQSLINKLGANLLDVTKTNSHWEDNRVAVEKKDTNWITENINCGVGIIPNVNFISTIDFNGNIISQVGDIKEFTNTLLYPKILEQLKKKSDFSGLVQTSKGLAIIAVSKITNEDGSAQPTGFLVFGRILDNKALGEIKGTLHNDIAILSNKGTFLSTSKKITKVAVTHSLDNHQNFHISHSRNTESAQMSIPLKDISNTSLGILYVDEKQNTSTLVKNKLIHVNLLIGVILLLILALLSFLIYRGMIIPIKHLVFVSEDVSKGILVEEVRPKIANRKDELGKLGNSMNIMIHNFRELIKEVTETIELVASSAEELSASSEETTRATHQIASAIQEVASGSETQLHGATESALAAEEMKVGMERIAETISMVSSDSTDTEKEAEQGQQSIVLAERQMGNINDSFHESASIVQKLSERSNEIGQIASLITDIANQTNLLALNAAIEAARAGEQGKGFAVVADEVRKLAEQTSLSAKQVSELVDVIQKESFSSAESMNKVSNEVNEGIKQIHEVGNAFKRILSATQSVAKQTLEISAVSEEISASTRQMAVSVENMASIARVSVDSSHQVASSSQEQLASMEEITVSTESLAKMAQNLKELIHHFKI